MSRTMKVKNEDEDVIGSFFTESKNTKRFEHSSFSIVKLP